MPRKPREEEAGRVMDNHMHLVIETPRPNLGIGMHHAHERFAQGFSRRHGTRGHVFEGRYKAMRVRSDTQFWMLAAYVAQNPVEAGLCGRPEDRRWSSHAATLGMSDVVPAWLDVSRMLELFSGAGGDPRDRYAEFVEAQRRVLTDP